MERKLKQIHLPELSKFSEVKGMTPGESMDLMLVRASQQVCCLTTRDNLPAALAYKQILIAGGKNDQDVFIEQTENPIHTALQFEQQDTIPLVINNATDHTLNERMFIDGPSFGQLFMSHIYMPLSNHQSPALYSIGIGRQSLEKLGQQNPFAQVDQSTVEKMEQVRREILGENIVTNNDFRKILKSGGVKKIIAHALGPEGTNISQAMRQYLRELNVYESKTNLIIHQGVEPLEYAEIAASQIENGVLSIHMECAVYYDMGKLFEQRQGEVVFADHLYMPLDAMQLASEKSLEELLSDKRQLLLASHPSPKPLSNPWLTTDKVTWIKATSNSAAAEMVVQGQADCCITTASGKNNNNLITHHTFGSPMMLFTIGTALNQQQLKNYLERL